MILLIQTLLIFQTMPGFFSVDLGPGVTIETSYKYRVPKEDLTRDNILYKNPVESHISTTEALVDGNADTIQLPLYYGQERIDSKFYRYYGISLEGIYRLEKIVIFFGLSSYYIPNNWFDVYLASSVNLCNEKENFLHFRLIAKNLNSKRNYQVTTLYLNGSDIWNQQMTARYIVLASGDPFEFRQKARNFTLSEITAYGKLIEKYKHQEIEDEKFNVKLPEYLSWPEESFHELKSIQVSRRKTFNITHLSNYTKFLARPSDGYLIPVDYSQICVLAAGDSCLTLIGRYRRKFRFAVSLGSSLFPHEQEAYRRKFNNVPLYSVIKWLCHNCTRPRLLINSLIKTKEGQIVYLNNWTEKAENLIELLMKNTSIVLHISSIRDATENQLNLLKRLYVDFSKDYAFEKYGSMDEAVNFDLDEMNFENMPTPLRIINRIINDPIEHWILPLNFGRHKFVGTWGNYLKKKILENNWSNKKLEGILEYAKFFGPCRCKPLKKGPKRTVLNSIRDMKLNGLIERKITLPGSSYFPGIVGPHARALFNVRLSIDIIDSNSRIYLGYGVSSTQPWSYRIHEGYSSVWKIQVGCTTDDIEHKDYIRRWSKVTTEENLKDFQEETFHPFGGLIYLNFLGANIEDGHLNIELNGVYKAARFNRRLQNAEEVWDETKDETDFPWVELEGDIHSHCVQMEHAYEARGEQLAITTKTFDNWVKINHFFVGSNWRKARNEVAVFDIETAYSYGHSGYPWVCETDWFQFVADPKKMKIQKGAWGFCHELGHNFEKDYWKVTGSDESFNNLFCLVDYNYTQVMNVFRPNSLMFKRAEIIELMNHWKNPIWPLKGKILLTYYNYLGWKFGAGLLGNALYLMRLDHENNRDSSFTIEEKWIMKISNETGYDFAPFHRLMGWPFSEKVKNKLNNLPCWLPNDIYTQKIRPKIQQIEKEFNKNCKAVERYIPPYFHYDQDNDYIRRYFYVRNF